MIFTEIPNALGLDRQEWGVLTAFFQFHEEPRDRLPLLCVQDEARLGELLARLVERGIILAREEGGRLLYSLAPLDDWLPPATGAADPDRFVMERDLIERVLDARDRPSITIVGTREIRRRDLLVPDVLRYTTTIFPTVDLRLGTRCNLNCIYCLLGHENRTTRPVHEVVSDMQLARANNIEKVTFTGGEPTLHPALPKLVAAARTLGFTRMTLVTNGVTLSYPGYLDRLVEAGINAVGISFDTPDRDTAEAMWRRPVFDRVVAAYEAVARHPGLPLQSIAVITNMNFRQLPGLARFFSDLGQRIDNLFVPTLDFVMPEENAWLNRRAVVPTLSEVVPFVSKALDIAHAEGLPLTFRGIPFCLLPGRERWSFDRYMTIFELIQGPGGVVFDRVGLDLRRTKAPQCARCLHNRECTGVSTSYANIHGLGELRPVLPGQAGGDGGAP